MKRMVTALVAAGLTTSLVGLSATTAEAGGPVTINKIGTKTVRGDGAALVRPTVKAARGVRVGTPRMDVYVGRKRVARNLTAARIKPGTYTIRTRVNYRTPSKKAVYGIRTVAAQGTTIDPTCTITSTEQVLEPVTDPLFDVLGTVPALGDLVADLLGGVVGTVVPLYSYTASCSWNGSYHFALTGYAGGLDVADQSLLAYGGADGVPATAPAGRGPGALVGHRFVATGAAAPVDVRKKVRTGTRTVYSGLRTARAAQKLVVRRR